MPQRFGLATRLAGAAAALLLLAPALPAPDAGDSHERLRSWLTRIAMDQLAARKKKVDSLNTPAEIRQRGKEARETLLRMIGGLPVERTPLNVQRTGVLDRGDYRVEKIIFESMPKL